jgi:hypothetical protein
VKLTKQDIAYCKTPIFLANKKHIYSIDYEYFIKKFQVFSLFFMEFYEVRLRNGKIGFPAGVFSGGNSEPSNVEALYKRNLSKRLCLKALEAHQNFFNGDAVNSNSSDVSFASYLDFLNTIKEGEDLTTLINNQYETTKNVINSLNDNFYEQISTNNTQMLEAFESLQDNVIYLKSDMFSALSISLEFSSGDGD